VNKFRKKPVVISAIQWDGTEECINRIVSAFDRTAPFRIDWINKDCGIVMFIRTEEGVMNVSKDDWVIEGVKGELYPCKPDIFDATYEAVSE